METSTETKRYRLNNKNYATWATMMRAEMYGLGCLPIIKREAVEGVVDKNMKLYVLIMKHLDEEHIAIVNSELGTDKEGKGLELWELFKKKYAGSEAHHQMLALGEFIDLEFKETKEFVKEIRNGVSKIRTSGLDVKEQVLALLILKKLPKEFKSLVRIIIQDSGTLKIEEVINKIEKDYLQFKLKKADKVAMVGQQQQGPRRTGKCYNCDIVGHSAKECRKPWTNYKFAPPKANVGETESVNISFIAVKDESPTSMGEETEEEITFYDPITTKLEVFGNLGNDNYYNQIEIDQAMEKIARKAMTGITTANNAISSTEAIILDSGASDHMFNNIDDFVNYVDHHGKVEIGEVGRSVEIIGKGDVVLTSNNNTITLCNTFHVPSLPYCLISQTSLWNGGAQIVKTHGDQFEVTVEGRKLFDGKIKNRLPFPNLERKRNTCQHVD
ncbi:uncharacterized protein VP01_4252g1 [Puccinia sorghi]|uniref:CCHC-type domain-containing protein n=1 Tax=Puccinia sorghi TaxID=27349 RepID=A0A0L6UR90_9BASI|nr:uncharacterized protein VP01_4252g1 [Puccinia sorghi]